MKKLVVFINLLLAMLSSANKKIIKLKEELLDTRFELESAQHDVESASGIINKWMSMYRSECEQTRKALEDRDRYRRVWLKTIDRYVDLLDKMDSYMEKYNIYEKEAQEEEQEWMLAIVNKYDDTESEFDYYEGYRYWIERVKKQEDREYCMWVERELGNDPHWWDDAYGNLEFEEDDLFEEDDYPWSAE